MMFLRAALTQTGTTHRAARGFLVLSTLLGCAQDSGGTGEPEPIGQKDAESQKDDYAESCARQHAAIATFVAAHNACTSDRDCAIVGDCTHADFQSVARSAVEEASALVLGNTCSQQDGPTYGAVCRANRCERVLTGGGCGQPLRSDCPDGTTMQQPGCSPGAGEATFTKGCFASCTDDSACARGYTCQTTTVDPCVPAPGANGTCAACGAQTKLCLPAPDCEVELAITFGSDSTVKRVTAGGSVEMNLSLKNRTGRALELAFDVPCPGGPSISGLGAPYAYDVYETCGAGRCLEDVTHERVALAANEVRVLQSVVLEAFASTCNANGLPHGRLAPSFGLSQLTGAKICGPSPVTLISSVP